MEHRYNLIDLCDLPIAFSNRPRDYALVEKIECTQDGSIVFACTSVETPRIPKVPGRVRAHVKVQFAVLVTLFHQLNLIY